MADISKVFENEKLLEKVATAETRDDAKKVCKEGGLEVSDADLDAIAGGLTTTQKVLIGVASGVGGAALAAGTYYTGKHFGWWGKKGPSLSLQERNAAYGTFGGAGNGAGIFEGKITKMPDDDDEPNVQPDEKGNN